jgi:heptosyltransferase-2
MNGAIAIIQTAFLGDAALAMLFAQQVRNTFPNAPVLFVGRPDARALAEANPSITRTIVFDKRGRDRGPGGIMRRAAELRSAGVKTVFCLQRSIRTALLAIASGARVRIGFSTATGARLFTHRVPYATELHEIERNAKLLAALGVEPPAPQLPLELRLRDDQHERVRTAIERTGKQPRIAIAPGAVWATKRWLPERFGEVARMLHRDGASVAFLGGASDRELCTAIARQSGGYVLAGELDPAETVAFLRSCTLLIANDSAPTHLATLAACPTITIFGSTVPAFGFGPRAPGSVTVEPPPLECRPCGTHGRRQCPLGTLECMHSIEAADVLRHARTLLLQARL